MKTTKILQIANLLGILGVITVNILANTLPINNVNTGQVSADYENLFTPAGFTFSIWSLIYLGLLVFGIYQVSGFQKPVKHLTNTIPASLGIIFLVNCLSNIFWIFAWHHYQLQLSLILMVFILTTLVDMNIRLSKINHSNVSYWTSYVPLGLYLGWICVATIANFAVYLTAIDWNGFGISEFNWALLLVLIAGVIALILLRKIRSYAAALAIAWGLAGIYFKLIQTDGNQFLQIVVLVVIAFTGISIGLNVRKSGS